MKTKIIFFIVAGYILIAFIWWGYSLIKLRSFEVSNEQTNLYVRAVNCQHQLADSIRTARLEADTIYLRNVFSEIDTGHLFTLNFLDSGGKGEQLYSGQYIEIVPRQSILIAQDEYLKRKINQYLGEGLFFIALVIWGMVLLYRNFQGRLKLKQQQNNFILAVTHELKTPVAGIKLILQTMQRRALSELHLEELKGNAVIEIERLEQLVENVLLASRIDNFKYEFHRENIELTELLEESISRFERTNFKGHYFRLIAHQNSSIKADRFAINTVFDNLISNSIKYSPDGSEISITVEEFGQKIRVSLCDEGTIIPLEEREKVFTKFYRLGSEQTRSSKGTGLGLYIVKQILEAHHASISIHERSDNKGNEFVLEFTPAALDID